jgi:FMN phosphatase YigB (HAD superfamily)
MVTDGQGRVQRGKLRALGLDGVFDPVVVTGDLGAQH